MSLLFALLYLFSSPDSTHSVRLELNSSARGGTLYVAVYDTPESFEEDRALYKANKSLKGNAASLSIDLPSTGRYTVAAFHDLNGNGKLDRNVFGIPTEPYGFNREPESKWRAPAFEEISEAIGEETTYVELELLTWKER